ncbi:enoyl-CoA hydratase/isomerase family protein [Nocardia sp. NEAU-G5]|uniref:Enoyl-CoA hydratase/isomerase family protein n=1 Tax=Nocardia albiluteola TaxID=2842303 RepID=A0ABS6B9Y5_9NOCA|nr:enoyl-CoA hydratase/isomerase family protein [Nocardia albiluteola]MBU3066556.1 enoyl-CoA hydratase/isomerase family protein [Nocardia albiluteola]
MTAHQPLTVEWRDNGVVVVTFTNPAKRNPMSAELTAHWSEAMRELRGAAELRAVVVTGAGPAFCSGADLGELGGTADADLMGARAHLSEFYRTWLSIRNLPVPTIAAVNGHAIGAGLALALACDLRYVVPTARLGVPFVQLGLHAGMATTALLPEAVGMQRARELLFTGRVISGAEAVELGIALPAGESVLDTALDTAAQIAGAAPIAVRLTKTALAAGQPSVEQALAWEALAQPVTTQTADFTEGITARREHRRPHFLGR